MNIFGKLFSYGFLLFNILIIYILDPFVHKFNIADYNTSQPSSQYDFIVVGSGSAGCVVAGRLAEANFSVLLLEAGGSDKIMPPLDPVKLSFAVVVLNESNYLFNYNGEYEFLNETKVRNTLRGKIFGGTGSVNAQMWNKGSKKIYDHWEKLGNEGWNSANVSEYFNKVENKMHILKGPHYFHEMSQDVLSVAKKIYGSFDDAHEKEEGFGTFHSSSKDGFRQTSCDAYIKPLLSEKKLENLHIKLHSYVTKLLFSDNKQRVIGIEYTSIDDIALENPRTFQVKANLEVVISAGTYDSPTLLMRSGIGNAPELNSLGINVNLDLPGVGKNYQNHFVYPITFKAKKAGWRNIYMNAGLKSFYNAWKYGTGPLTTQGVEFQGFFKSNFSKYKNINDFHYLCGTILGSTFKEDMPEYFEREPIFSCITSLATPKKKGFVKLSSKKLSDPPIIHGVYAKDKEDLKALYESFLNIKKLFEDDTHKEYFDWYMPKQEEALDLESFSRYVEQKFYPIYHAVGTCKMGDIKKDPLSVVNHELKIHGIKGARVIDGSVIPEMTTTNPNAPIIMIAEKGADMILTEHLKA